MCGIALVFCRDPNDAKTCLDRLRPDVQRRGPDARRETIVDREGRLRAFGAVLHLRGTHPVPQPLIRNQQECTHVENSSDETSTKESDGYEDVLLWNGEVFGGSVRVAGNENDTSKIMSLIQTSLAANDNDTGRCIVDALDTVEGPWAIVFWHARTKTLWFGRDRLGRRSLLLRPEYDDDDDDTTASSVKSRTIRSLLVSSVVPHDAKDDACFVRCDDENDRTKPIFRPSVWQAIPPAGLFGVQLSSDETYLHDIVLSPFRTGSCESDVPTSPPMNEMAASLELERILRDAVRRRVCDIAPRPEEKEIVTDDVGILFSGGLDSAVLAALCGRVLAPRRTVELINVCFDSPTFASPDRATAIRVFKELRETQPRRTWRLILVNVTFEEVQRHARHVWRVIRPRHTHMDFNIATAMWFAARGQGRCFSSSASYRSRARVLLLGIGADEQMGGYGRHLTKWRRDGESGLRLEMRKDVNRLWRRNLGRDDRVISDHGKEVRLPFLDERVTSLLSTLPLRHIVDHNSSTKTVRGDKIILRRVARSLGLIVASGLKKRAIQFGTRIAKRSNVHLFGSNRQANKRKAGSETFSIDDIVGPPASPLISFFEKKRRMKRDRTNPTRKSPPVSIERAESHDEKK